MQMTEQEVFAKLLPLVQEVTGAPAERIRMESVLIEDLGAKGIIGYADHGFTSASFLRRFVNQARTKRITSAWFEIWRDDEAEAYTWYEQNERHGKSYRKTFLNALCKGAPAYLVRKDNTGEALTPENLAKPPGGDTLVYGVLTNQLRIVQVGKLEP